ncbi:MAG: DUF2452 domain-containing protein [Halioglobus sp.]|nr:DUF2452 domain-containing protein [Halioglobus sp.]
MSCPLSTPNKNPNPQGKGVVPILKDWSMLQPTVTGPKGAAEFLRDYAVSSLILTANFGFKPVIGNTYFLYTGEKGWTLSLISPSEWGQSSPGEFLARCRLRIDMTWEMIIEEPSEHSDALAKARSFIKGFVDVLAEQNAISTHLPFYESHLPYYQRMLGTALASSLKASLPAFGDSMKTLMAEQSPPRPDSSYLLCAGASGAKVLQGRPSQTA